MCDRSYRLHSFMAGQASASPWLHRQSFCDEKKTAHLLGLEGAAERLQLFKADLLAEGSFDSAMEGCVAVFHTASPVSFSAADPQAEVFLWLFCQQILAFILLLCYNRCEEINTVKLPEFRASKEKAEEGLGIKFVDTIECLKDKGFLHF
ncbi:unnamed protein product [Linum tenue]|uniref:Uncharacterized protein n=1 Tax=Linum tenue TaxID=586396 RepID=A0AAV0N979_9ROSI|nr:unnamed protein product [Linum tenue]